MEIFILILLIILESGLLIISVAKKVSKDQWSKLRFIITGCQFGLFSILLLTPLLELNIRFKLCFIVLTLKLVFACISFFVAKNNHSRKSPALLCLTWLVSCIVILLSLVPSFIFANYHGLPTTGIHDVASSHFILIDENRDDPFEGTGSHREVPVYAFYPADGGSENEYPLVVFSHGAFGYYESNMSTYQELASNGYVVLSIEHPHHSLFTKLSNGKTVTVDNQFMADTMNINSENATEEYIFETSSTWVDLRITDMNFVIDTFENAKENHAITDAFFTVDANSSDILNILEIADTSNIGLFGHSLGGATAVTAGRTRNDVGAVIDIDGTMLGEELSYENGSYIYNEEPYPIPLLVIDNEEHHTQSTELEVLYVNNYICSNAIDATTIWFKGSGHMNFTDLPLFSPFLASQLGTGSIDSEDCVVQMNSIILDFFNFYLKEEGELTLKECYE